jgi:hypothetical protein
MKKLTSYLILGILLLMFVSCNSSGRKDAQSLYTELDKNSAPNTLTNKEKRAGWQLLFDGKNNTGWHGYNLSGFPDCWTIDDGTFTMTTQGSGESQDIITDKKYRNFAFSVNFKLSPAANSGIIFQIEENPKYKFPYETGPECQIIDNLGWPGKLEDWQKCGANYAMYPPLVDHPKPVGEWNHLLIVVDGNNVTQMLNGEIVAKYVKYSDEWNKLRNSGKWVDFPDWGKYDEGHISLQNHGTRVWFKNIKLKEL